MSEALVQIEGNQALQQGGVGYGASIFRARPSIIELVQKTSRAENVVYGEFRVVSTNAHLGKVIRVVLLAVPQVQREWFKEKNVFTKENRKCFSIDGVRPFAHALEPPAAFCGTCPKGDINWATWRKTHDPNDLPSCGAYWNLLVADRQTQRPYYLNIKGKSFKPFKDAMEQQLSGLLQDIFANVRAENKKRGFTFVKAEERFVPTPGYDGTLQIPLPMPNIFDVSFDITSNNVNSPGGSSFVMSFSKFAMMSEEDKAEFGQLYLDTTASKIAMREAAVAEQDNDDDVVEAPASRGEILPPAEPITI